MQVYIWSNVEETCRIKQPLVSEKKTDLHHTYELGE